MKNILRSVLVLYGIACIGLSAILGNGNVNAASPGAIRIGVPGPFTGFLATDGKQHKNGALLAVEEINKGGGILGRPLEVIFGDTGGQETEKMIAVGQMFMSKKIDAAIAAYAPSPTDVLFFGDYEIPYLHCDTTLMATKPVREGLPHKMWNIFQYDPNAEEHYGIDAVRYFILKIPKKMGWNPPNKRVAVIAADYPYNLNCALQFKSELPKDYEVVVDEITPFGVTDWGAILAKVRMKQPAFITFWTLSPSDVARFVSQFAENPTNSIFYAQYSPIMPEFLDIAKNAANGVIFSSTIAGVGPKYKRWIKKYEAKYGPVGHYSATQIYDGFHIYAAAVKRAGSVTAYREIARNILEYPYDGLCGHFVFNHYDQSALQGEGLIPNVFYQIQNQVGRIVEPAQFATTGKLEIPSWIKK